MTHLKNSGIEPLTPLSLIVPIHKHKALNLGHISLPFTETIAKEFLYLPITPELNDDQLQICRLMYPTVLSDVLTFSLYSVR